MQSSSFTLLTEDHHLISAAADRLFGELAADDTASRQRVGKPLNRETIATRLREFGLVPSNDGDEATSSNLAQAQIALAAGGACLSYPVLETLLAHGLESVADVRISNIAFSTAMGKPCTIDQNGLITALVARVAFAAWADVVLIPIHRGDDTALVRVPIAGPGVELITRQSVEPDYQLYDIRLDAVAAIEDGETFSAAGDQIASLRRRSNLLAAAELAGACRRMVAMTKEYLLSRTQFGQVLGAHQALKHRLADAHVSVEAMVAAINYAAAASDAADGEAEVLVASAKLFAGSAGKTVAESALQLHGAIGYTMEYPLHLLMRRVYRLANSFTTGAALEQSLFNQFRIDAKF